MFSNLVAFKRKLSSYLCRTLVVTVAATMALPAMAAPIVLDASFESWLRANDPSRTLAQWDDDLISVWSGATGDARIGVVEFDLSSLQGTTILDLRLGMWSGDYDSASNFPHKQVAVIISPPDTSNLNWNDALALPQTPLETLGSYDLAPLSSTPELDGVYLFSMGSAADIALVQAIADVGGTLTLKMLAVEDGNQYRVTWGDGAYDGEVPQLLINIPEPTSVLLLGLGGVFLCGCRRLV